MVNDEVTYEADLTTKAQNQKKGSGVQMMQSNFSKVKI